MFRKKKTYIILGTIILVAGGFYYSKKKEPETTYSTAQAEKGKIIKTVSVTGEIVPPIEIDLAFKLSGRIQSFFVGVGDKVEEGQKIATIDQGTLPDQLEQARYDLDYQKRTLDNMERRDDTYNHFQKKAQKEVVKKAESNVNEVLRQIEDTVLYSPIDGTIIKKEAEIGEVITASTSNIVTIASEGELEVEVEVPESDIVDVIVGQTAKVSLDALPSGETLVATVSKIDPASTVISDVVYYKVKLKFNHPDERLKVGMSADVDINTAEKENAIMIPMRSVKGEGEENYVEVLKSDNTVERVDIRTGLEGDEGMIEVVSGLSGGENVVVLSK